MAKPRIGFLGTGWIGRHRMEALVRCGSIKPVAFMEPDDEAAGAAALLAQNARRTASLDELLEQDLDGIVIATPSAQHAAQSIAALEQGIAVFCQKPLGCSAAETRSVVDAARQADRLLAVDFSYRFAEAILALLPPIRSGELGDIFAADLVFHNAYGPDKAWFRDRSRSGGGCVIDLGIHLVDLLLWILDDPEVERVSSNLFANGRPLLPGSLELEDYAAATIELSNGTVAQLRCSWNLHAGRDAEIRIVFHGTRGSVCFSNVEGSFYDFACFRYDGTQEHVIAAPPDDWGGRAAISWAGRLAESNRFDSSVDQLISVSQVIDRIYAYADEPAPA